MTEGAHSPPPSLGRAVGLAIAASFLWAMAIILVKMGLEDIPRLTFASLRYFVGAMALLIWRGARTGSVVPSVPRPLWRWLVALGVLMYGIVPATQFISLDLIDATAFNFIFQAGIPLVTALFAGVVLREPTSRFEWLGVVLVAVGMFIFYPAMPRGNELVGLILAAIAAFGIGSSNLLQRLVMRGQSISALDAALVPMALGSVGLFLVSRTVEPFPNLGGEQVVLILVLGVVNTALAFTMWNQAMRTLNALHSSIIASAQVIEVPILALIILGESLTAGRGAGSILVLGGILVVHFSKAAASRPATIDTHSRVG